MYSAGCSLCIFVKCVVCILQGVASAVLRSVLYAFCRVLPLQMCGVCDIQYHTYTGILMQDSVSYIRLLAKIMQCASNGNKTPLCRHSFLSPQ